MKLPFALPRPTKGFQQTALFRPRSVVLVADPALPEAALLARNLAEGGFKGNLHVVGMAADGLVAAPDIPALPEVPDLAVLCIAPDAQPAAMAALAARGCFAAVVPVAAPELAELSERTGVRVLGAHSFGLCLPALGLNASLSHMAPRPGRLALLTQSPAMARTIIDWAAGEELGFSHIIGIGTNLGLGFALSLDWLAREPEAGAVLLDLRRIKSRRLFISAARATARTRPVVAIRPGGRQADATGIADAVMEAALRRAGVLRVGGLEDLLSAAETLARLRPASRSGRDALAGDRIAIVANGQGPAQLAADAVLQGGARLAVPGEAARAAMAFTMPSFAMPSLATSGGGGSNPLVVPPDQSHRLAEAASMLAALPEVDAVVAVHAPAPGQDGEVAASALAAAAKATRGAPVLVAWLGQATAAPARRRLAEGGLAVFPTPEAAIRGALHLAMDRRNRAAAAELPAREALELTPDRDAVRRLIDGMRAESRVNFTEAEALRVLQAYGQPVVAGQAVPGVDAAVAAAMRLGFPVVLKILSPDLPRKTEVGGVALGLKDVAGLRAAAAAMLAQVRAARPEARIDGFLVQRQAAGGGRQRGHELRFRLGDDPMFGPWISYGRGGTTSDFEPDVAFDLPPLNRTLALALIRRTRSVRLLEGFRDQAPVDINLLADAAVRLSQIAVDFPEIEDLIINPLLADGSGVLALDASGRLRLPGVVAQLAVPPYPAELARPWIAPDGRGLTVRPIRPEDAAAHAEAFRHLRPEDVRWRFFSLLKELPPAQIARMTQIDYDREMAFVATEALPDGGCRTVGVARLIRQPGSDEGEFAVVTLPGWRGQGLGRHLMERLFEWGRGQGVETVVGQVLADNVPMIAFVRALGFALKRSAEDEDVLEARLEL
ncbi:bifunctional acyl-CoA synthetase/GNAT family N-acetyltransferase [Roseomonas sp. M0104]|uniref:Bifunctional acyl-CoA synthetase/GNAT family N-acetyltransferase n=1 Tax=Teichococcus coralli TaxID=2545983 RepID=A0A845BB94_9PROT|nr:GNAT family N-acetyltransferase [Pseudoroseomonas coralli]MXP63386.1 bifunctional acyl-CoA synthetase/GNAT family N-acetyltransferase [Pseudoroseomonas coralli]